MKGYEEMIMSVEQFAEYCECSTDALLKNVKRYVEKVEKCGKFNVTKRGRGKSTQFELEPRGAAQDKTNQSIISLFEQEEKDIRMIRGLCSLAQLEFGVLLVLLSHPQETYRGSLDQWTTEICRMLDMQNRKENRTSISTAIDSMETKGLVWVHKELGRVSVMLRDTVVFNGFCFSSKMMADSKVIAGEIGARQRWESVLKVWLACQLLVVEYNKEVQDAYAKQRKEQLDRGVDEKDIQLVPPTKPKAFAKPSERISAMTNLSSRLVGKIMNKLIEIGAFKTQGIYYRDSNGVIIGRYGTHLTECGWTLIK